MIGQPDGRVRADRRSTSSTGSLFILYDHLLTLSLCATQSTILLRSRLSLNNLEEIFSGYYRRVLLMRNHAFSRRQLFAGKLQY